MLTIFNLTNIMNYTNLTIGQAPRWVVIGVVVVFTWRVMIIETFDNLRLRM